MMGTNICMGDHKVKRGTPTVLLCKFNLSEYHEST